MPQSIDLTINDDEYQTVLKSAFPVIEYHMLDKTKYFPLVVVSGIAVRSVLYPLTLIKTRMQVQTSRDVYSGTFDALVRIVKSEGPRGLYSGFLVHNCSMVSQMTFLTTYEGIRHILTDKYSFKSNQKKAFVAGGIASAVAQTIVVPIDIVSQHLQVRSIYLGSQQLTKRSTHSHKHCQHSITSAPADARGIIFCIFRESGFRGFYKGFFISVITYGPTSAVWWLTYDYFCDLLSSLSPVHFPRLLIQCTSATLSGSTTTFLTTPLDAVRARVQVRKTKFLDTLMTLWKEERWKIFVKALSPRLIQNVISSFFVILGYETIKKWSLSGKYKNQFHL